MELLKIKLVRNTIKELTPEREPQVGRGMFGVHPLILHFQFQFSKSIKLLTFHFQEKEKTNSGYKHNSKVSHGMFNLTFRMLQHTSSEATVTKYDEI